MVKVCLFFALVFASIFAISAQNIQKNSPINQKINEIGSALSAENTSESKSPESVAEIVNKSISSVLKATKTLGAYTTGDASVDGYILDSCTRYNVDPLLIFAQMNQESTFKQKAVSPKGARGLMQLMPDTAVRFGAKNIYDPQQNIEAGVKYMRWLLDRFGGDVNLALAGYNAGEGAVKKYGNQIPPYSETINYVARITAHYNKIKTNNESSIKLNEESAKLN